MGKVLGSVLVYGQSAWQCASIWAKCSLVEGHKYRAQSLTYKECGMLTLLRHSTQEVVDLNPGLPSSLSQGGVLSV